MAKLPRFRTRKKSASGTGRKFSPRAWVNQRRQTPAQRNAAKINRALYPQPSRTRRFGGAMKRGAGVAWKGGVVVAGAARAAGGKAKEFTTKERSLGSTPAWLGWTLLILGVIQFLLRTYVFESATPITFAISAFILFPLAGYALAAKLEQSRETFSKFSILLPMLLFAIWYFIYEGNYDPNFLMYFIPISLAVIVLPILASKGKSATPELLGFVPVIFLFLDIGLLPFLVDQLQMTVTPLLESAILFTPWWALFAIYIFPGENKIINILKIIGIFYLAFIFVAPVVPGLGYSDSYLPGGAQFEEAQARFRSQPSKENPFWSNIMCLPSIENIQGCVQERQLISEAEANCAQEHDQDLDPRSYEKCVEEEIERLKNPSASVKGTVDRSIREPTTAQIIIDQKSLPDKFLRDSPLPITSEIIIENPRKQELQIEVTCRFESKEGRDDAEGTVEGGELTSIKAENFRQTVLCYPPQGLEGRYVVHVEAKLKNLVSLSRLQRAFIGDKSPEYKEKLYQDEISKVITTRESQAANDLAFITFDVGHALGEPIIEDKDYRKLFVRSQIVNNGKGRIFTVGQYYIDLPGFMVESQQAATEGFSCLSGTILNTSKFSRGRGDIPLPTCTLSESYPLELKQPERWEVKEFKAFLHYDYVLSDKLSIKVEKE